jgi:hypothetical protein
VGGQVGQASTRIVSVKDVHNSSGDGCQRCCTHNVIQRATNDRDARFIKGCCALEQEDMSYSTHLARDIIIADRHNHR